MITWATTFAPETQFFGSSETSNIRRFQPGGADTTWTEAKTETSSYNWSRTEYYSSNFNSASPVSENAVFLTSSDSYFSIVGKVNSTTFAVETLSNDNTRSVRFGYTKRSVLNQTTTETTSAYSYRETGTANSFYTYRTVSNGVLGVFSQDSTTITTTSLLTAQETVTRTTTVTDETVATPILATVVRAEKNEVIWAMATTAATDADGLTYVLDLATSTTETTVLPWTKTVVAGQANTTETTAYTLQLISSSVVFQTEGSQTVETTTIRSYNRLPNVSETTQGQVWTTANSTLNFTVLGQSFVTATGANGFGTETIVVNSTITIPVTRRGNEFDSTTQTVATTTRGFTSTFAETRTEEETFATTAFPSEGAPYVWTQTFARTTYNELTTFQRIPQMVNRFEPLSPIARAREFYSGVLADGVLAAGYSCPEIGFVGGFVFPSVSRNVRSIRPSTAEYYQLVTVEEEFEDLELLGTITVSGLSVTKQESDATTTQSFSLEPLGDPMSGREFEMTDSRVDGQSMGQSETIYETLASGVYSRGSETFSTTGGARAFRTEEASSQDYLIPLSFAGASVFAAGGDVVTWTASRNSHVSIGQRNLTQAGAYSAV
jgi:hypothetical protein